jgi:hypothetical protein
VPFGAQKSVAQVMDLHASKTLCTGRYKSWVGGRLAAISPVEPFSVNWPKYSAAKKISTFIKMTFFLSFYQN